MSKPVPGRITTRIDGHIAWLILDRPDKLNAMTIESWRLMGERLAEIEKNPDVRALILAGEGRAFLAGHDVGEMKEHADGIDAGTFRAAELHELQKHLQETTRRIRRARYPVIAAVQGFAVGAGCEVTLACDLVVAGVSTKLGFPEVNVGVTITNGGTFLLPRKVGLARARELAYTGEFIDAKEALAIGLVNRVVPDAEVRAQAEALARRIASRAPLAVQLHKTMIDRGLESSLEAMLNFETEALVVAALSDDHREGVTAFFARREPNFRGT
ncbi:MAG: enoyl-CoA hydratase/isomerase family protein [Alphaproteobacteria bacterium]